MKESQNGSEESLTGPEESLPGPEESLPSDITPNEAWAKACRDAAKDVITAPFEDAGNTAIAAAHTLLDLACHLKGPPHEGTMRPTIQMAKDTARRMNARQVVVCAFDYNGRMAVVSYGVTKAECQDVRPLCDAIADNLEGGVLPYPRINW